MSENDVWGILQLLNAEMHLSEEQLEAAYREFQSSNLPPSKWIVRFLIRHIASSEMQKANKAWLETYGSLIYGK